MAAFVSSSTALRLVGIAVSSAIIGKNIHRTYCRINSYIPYAAMLLQMAYYCSHLTLYDSSLREGWGPWLYIYLFLFSVVKRAQSQQLCLQLISTSPSLSLSIALAPPSFHLNREGLLNEEVTMPIIINVSSLMIKQLSRSKHYITQTPMNNNMTTKLKFCNTDIYFCA